MFLVLVHAQLQLSLLRDVMGKTFLHFPCPPSPIFTFYPFTRRLNFLPRHAPEDKQITLRNRSSVGLSSREIV